MNEYIKLGAFVSVTDKYRTVMPKAITWGHGQGQVTGFETSESDWFDELEITVCHIKWADGYESTMHPVHLQPSTKKAFFTASIKG